MLHHFSRTEMLIGSEGVATLAKSTVAVFGVGGVGSYVVEALARAGVGHLVLVDHDTVSLTNINRQLPALHSTIGQKKVDVMKRRIADINPACQVEALPCFYQAEVRDTLLKTSYDFVVDAIDSITAKVDLIASAKERAIPIVSSMGAGNKLDASRFTVTDISKTHTCPLAKTMRKLLKERGIYRGLPVVFSTEPPLTPRPAEPEEAGLRRQVPGSIAFVPATAGLLIASTVVNQLLQK